MSEHLVGNTSVIYGHVSFNVFIDLVMTSLSDSVSSFYKDKRFVADSSLPPGDTHHLISVSYFLASFFLF